MGFPSHDRSDCYKEAVERLVTLPANTRRRQIYKQKEFAKGSVKPTIFWQSKASPCEDTRMRMTLILSSFVGYAVKMTPFDDMA